MLSGRVFILYSCCIFVTQNVKGQRSRLVNTTQGPVNGYEDFDGVFAFYGIPYGTTPTGPHKFQAPLPPPTWLEPLEAVNKVIACPQLPFLFPKPYRMVQDCLVVNVFVPDTEETNLPVVVIIHGGGFSSYFGNLRTPSNVVRSENVIVVTFNYRLGLHGFLCLGTKGAPGNAGLKDQLAALKWVNRNIAAFGGSNPNEVTIDGYSAGTACVDILALSPAAAGYFNKVIIGSVVSLNSPLVVIDPIKNAKIFAAKLGFNNTEDISALEKFYTENSLKTFLFNALQYLQLMEDTSFYFSPCIESNNDEEQIKIITEPPFEILKKGKYSKVPMLYAFASKEGLLRKKNFDDWKDEMNRNFHKFLPGSLNFKNEQERDMVANQVKSFYFVDNLISNDHILNYTDFFSDSVFISTMFRAIKMHLRAGSDKIYLFEYPFISEEDEIIPYTNVRGAGHCAENYAVLDGTETILQSNETDLSDDLKKMKEISRNVWATFVKTGAPVLSGSALPSWPPVGPEVSPHVVMTLNPRLEYEWDEQFMRRVHFWDNLYQLYGATPIPPSSSVPVD